MELSMLNLVPLKEGKSAGESMDEMVTLAREAERLGYVRYWLAEHHNSPTFLSSATALLIGKVLENTKTIRVGSGGVMLPNHSPLLVAEYYGTLETLYPGRVDLGLGRAPGTDQKTARVLRRSSNLYSDFEEELAMLDGFFKDRYDVHAYPAAGLDVPFYILGSSTDSAYVAAELGLPYAFASHFAPQMLEEAVKIYRTNFQPSEHLAYPYVIIGVNVIAADTDEEAERLGTTSLRASLGIVTGTQEALQPPVENEQAVWDNFAHEVSGSPHFGPVQFSGDELKANLKGAIANFRSMRLSGSPETIKEQYIELKKKIDFDEMMVTGFFYDTQAQIHSLEIIKAVVDEVENA